MALGLTLAILGAVSWAVLDILRKSIGEHVSASGAVTALALFQLPFLAMMLATGEFVTVSSEPWATFLTGMSKPDSVYGLLLVGTVGLNVVANWLFLRAVQLSPLGLTIPYLSFTPVFTTLSGGLFLGEWPGALGAVGVVIVTLGAFALNPGDQEHRDLLSPLRALWSERGSVYMVGVALIWSITPVIDKLATGQVGVVSHTALVAFGIFAAFALLRSARDRGLGKLARELGRKPGLLVGAAFINVLGMVFQLSAYAFADVAYVETLKRAIGVIAAVVAGNALFGESGGARRVVAAVVMAVGVSLVLMSG